MIFEYFHDMLSFWVIYRKWHKTGNFRDLFLESAIFKVGTQNWYEMYLTPAANDFGVKTYKIVGFL